MSIYNTQNVIDKDAYAQKESYINKIDQNKIKKYQENNFISDSQKKTVINLLESIKSMAQKNFTELNEMEANLNVSKNFLTKQINALEEDNTLKNLSKFQIPKEIYSISATQFNILYDRIQELKYRLNIISYKITFLKEQKDLLNEDIELINKYIIFLQG